MYTFIEKTPEELREMGYVFQGYTDVTRRYEVWFNFETGCRYEREA